MTFEDYLKKEIGEGKIDFSIRATYYRAELKFYIHPEGKDGCTEDYIVTGNTLEPQRQQPNPFFTMDTSENFHPYECDGAGKCVHCDKKKTETHNPETCALCAEG